MDETNEGLPIGEQIEEAKRHGVLLTPIPSKQSHVNYAISILNQRLYLINQLRTQGLNVSWLTQVFMALVVARLVPTHTNTSGHC